MVAACGIMQQEQAVDQESKNKWSQKVWDTSDALGFSAGLFTRSAEDIAKGLAEAGRNRHNHPGTPGKKKSTAKTDFQAAMCMLNYYINRAGKNLSDERRETLEAAKNALRREFGREEKYKWGIALRKQKHD